MNIDISIIVPIYNAQSTLERCILSLKGQSYSDFEVILMDDGSTDQSYEIAESLIASDARFRLFHQENHGQGHARNRGIEKATGRYIGFVDSDDVVDSRMIEIAYQNAVDNDADVLNFGYERQVGQKHRREQTNIQSDAINSGPVNKLFRRVFIMEHQLRFLENTWYEDISFTYPALTLAQTVVRIPDVLYFYVVRENSSVLTLNEKMFDIYTVLEDVYTRCIEQKQSLVYWFIIQLAFAHLIRIGESQYPLETEIKRVKETLDRWFIDWRHCDRLSLHNFLANPSLSLWIQISVFSLFKWGPYAWFIRRLVTLKKFINIYLW